MLKQAKKRNTCMKAYELPRLAVGDVLLIGKFKNRKATINGTSHRCSVKMRGSHRTILIDGRPP